MAHASEFDTVMAALDRLLVLLRPTPAMRARRHAAELEARARRVQELTTLRERIVDQTDLVGAIKEEIDDARRENDHGALVSCGRELDAAYVKLGTMHARAFAMARELGE